MAGVGYLVESSKVPHAMFPFKSFSIKLYIFLGR